MLLLGSRMHCRSWEVVSSVLSGHTSLYFSPFSTCTCGRGRRRAARGARHPMSCCAAPPPSLPCAHPPLTRAGCLHAPCTPWPCARTPLLPTRPLPPAPPCQQRVTLLWCLRTSSRISGRPSSTQRPVSSTTSTLRGAPHLRVKGRGARGVRWCLRVLPHPGASGRAEGAGRAGDRMPGATAAAAPPSPPHPTHSSPAHARSHACSCQAAVGGWRAAACLPVRPQKTRPLALRGIPPHLARRWSSIRYFCFRLRLQMRLGLY